MKLTTTTEHNIKFTVESFWDEEGGMGHDQFGESVETLADAVALLDIARGGGTKVGRTDYIAARNEPPMDWVIVARVETKVSGK